MKKIFILCLILMLSAYLFAKPKNTLNLDYSISEFPNDNSYLIDLFKFNQQSISNIKITFYANNPSTINILGNNPENKKWEQVAQLNLKGFSDSDSERLKNKNSINWRYFSIKPENNIFYNYKISISNKTLNVEIRGKNDTFDEPPKPKINIENSVVLDIKKYDAEDYVIFLNYTNQPELTIIPYYFDNYKWHRAYEVAQLKGFSDTDKIEIIDEDGIEDIRYLALDIKPYNEYKFRIYEKHSDLYVEICDETVQHDGIQISENINLIDE